MLKCTTKMNSLVLYSSFSGVLSLALLFSSSANIFFQVSMLGSKAMNAVLVFIFSMVWSARLYSLSHI